MANSIASTTDVTSSLPVTPVTTAPSPAPASTTSSGDAAAAASATASDAANMRLVIEDDKSAGCFVYKVINRVTGEVVQQTPSEQIVKLRESDGYLAGDVIKAQV